jgi:cell division septation protein DedD
MATDSGESTVVRTTPVAPSPPTPPPAAATPAPAAATAATADGRYVVRFGSFGDQANADRLVRRLKEKGVDADVEPVQAGERTLQRVVSQPLADRAAAEKLRLSVRKSMPEISAQVAELDLPTATASRVAQPVVSGWAVQVGVFSTTEAAEKLVADLRSSGHEGYFERMPSNGKVLYRVRVGPLARREDADRAAADIKAKRKLDGLVVTYP